MGLLLARRQVPLLLLPAAGRLDCRLAALPAIELSKSTSWRMGGRNCCWRCCCCFCWCGLLQQSVACRCGRASADRQRASLPLLLLLLLLLLMRCAHTPAAAGRKSVAWQCSSWPILVVVAV
jgi:hypothetical protein